MNIRNIHKGMGQAIAERTILRGGEDWYDVAIRVAHGNASIADNSDFANLRDHIAKANILMSGRHLQHGDTTQPGREMTPFTNCSTAAASFIKFYLLLNGSGVGRVYDDDMMVVNWDNAPNIKCVLDASHPDFDYHNMESLRDGKRKYHNCIWHTVEDSREGWAHALELWETMTWEGYNQHKTIVFDFSKVRPKGSPIGGMQDRPASGPAPLMRAFLQVASLKGLGWAPWKQAMWVDHYIADCVLVGGVRRSARIAGKWWKDPGIFEFIDIKRPSELEDLHTISEVQAYRKNHQFLSGFLWTANNSICVDDEFWELVNKRDQSVWGKHACKVFDLVTKRAYADGTGEPGFVTVSKLNTNEDGLEHLDDGSWFGSPKFQPQQYATQAYLKDLTQKFKKKTHKFFVNPCGEIVLSILGGFCVIADVVPFHCDTLEEAEDAVRAATRALIRVNTMPSVYQHEVRRTNRIGVGLTGVHEFAYKLCHLSFRDLLADGTQSRAFWHAIQKLSEAVRDEAETYSKRLGVATPHTCTTIKPAGTTSKLFGLTEGAHLPAIGHYMRWVQFSNSDPIVDKYAKAGYPTRKLTGMYAGKTIVGFPTKPTICEIVPEDEIVYAGDATPDEQYQYLRLLEKYWLGPWGNQISYTLKYKPDETPYEVFKDSLLRNQPTVKCCSVMPQEEGQSYEYLPEEPISAEEYEVYMSLITPIAEGEEVDREHIECAGGACPVDFKEK